MSNEAEYRFVFRGSAMAAGGRIRRPDLPIQSQAAALVGVSGGTSRVTASGADFGGIFRYQSAESEVRADYQDPVKAAAYTHGNYAQNRLPARSVVRTTLAGLSIVNADSSSRRSLTAASVTAELISQWPGTQGDTSFVSHKGFISELKLDQYVLDVTFNAEIFNDRDTKGKLKHAYESSDAFRRVYGRLFLRPAGQPGGSSRLPESGGETYCTIVNRISWRGPAHPNAKIDGHKVVLKDFGSIFFGELFISQFSRRLTLMRLELGSPCGGSIDVAEVETDGHGYPPY